MENNDRNQGQDGFLAILQNRNHVFGAKHGHQIIVGPEQELTSLEDACFNNKQIQNKVLTARYSLNGEHPSVVFGTLMRKLASDVLDWPNILDDPFCILRQHRPSSNFGWFKFKSLAQKILDSIQVGNDASIPLNWVIESIKSQQSSQKVHTKSPYPDALENGSPLIGKGERIVIFLQLKDQGGHTKDWDFWLEKFIHILPYRSLLVISGLHEVAPNPDSSYQHLLELPSKEDTNFEASDNSEPEIVMPAITFKDNPALNDTPNRNDTLSRRLYVDAIARLLAHKETIPPLTLGIHGPWGMGKSTFMRQLAERLQENEEQDFLIVDFNAWRYNDAHQVWAGLLNKVAQAVEEKIGWWQRHWWVTKTYLSKEWKKIILCLFLFLALAKVIVSLSDMLPTKISLVSLSFSALISLFINFFQKSLLLSTRIAKAAQFPQHHAELGFQNVIMDELKEMQNIIKKQKKSCRIAIFIDDLDRCDEDRIIETLQAIILVLAESEMIVIMGIDTHMIYRAVEQKYPDLVKKDQGSCDFSRRYLRKIIQLPFHLPPIGAQKQKMFINGMFSPESLKNLEARQNQVNHDRKTANLYPPNELPLINNPTLLLDVNGNDTINFEDISVRDTATELQAFHDFQGCLDNNPREIKRAINIHRLMKLLLQARGIPQEGWPDDRQRRLVRWILFTTGWPELVPEVLHHSAKSTRSEEDVINYSIDKSKNLILDPNRWERLLKLKSQMNDLFITPIDVDEELRFVANTSVLLRDHW